MFHKDKIAKLILVIVLAGVVVWIYLYLHSRVQINAPNPNQNAGNQTSLQTATQTQPSELILKPVSVGLSNGKKFSLSIPQHYTLSAAAQGFRHARFMAFAPDGRLFLGDITSANDASTGKVYVLDSFDEQSGMFKSQQVYLSNLRNPNSIAFYTDDSGTTWIYVALTDKLVRYKYAAGQNVPASEAQTIITLPGTPPVVANGFWHFTRTIIIHDNTIYLSIGSSCNSCEQTDSNRAVILKMNPDGSNQQTIASGLRNAVGIDFVGNDLFATANEIDNLGNDKPDDLLYKIVPGANYGWPYCYQSAGKIYADVSQKWKQTFNCSIVPVSWAAFMPHSAPLGLAYFDNNFADPLLKNSFLIALHGATETSLPNGNEVVMARQGTTPVKILSGFLQSGKRFGRPVDVQVRNNNSFFVSDDLNGVIYYLAYHQ